MSVSAVRQRQWLLALLVFACGLVMVSFWLRHSAQQEEAKSRALAADLAADHAQSLQRGIERALSATYAIAALVHQGRGFVNDFNGVATQMLPFYPGIAAIWLSPGGVICCVVPRAGNENSIGFNQLEDVAQNKEARRARDTGKLTLAGPVQLAQGGLGVVGRLPIYLGQGDDTQVFWGFSYVTLRFPQALESARLEMLRDRGYAYELWRTNPETGERQRIEAWKPEALRDPVGRDLELPNGAWTLSLAPTRGWVQRSGLMLEGLVGTVFSALLAYLAWLLYAMRLRDLELEALVAQRTSEILAAQRHLQATISAIPDLMFEVDLDGRYYSTHSPREELLARPSKELLGRTVHDVMPQAQADRVLQALQEAHVKGWSMGAQICLPLDIGERWFELSVARKASATGEGPRFVVISRDVTDNKLAEEKVLQLAHFDALTGLPNRSLLADRCQQALGAAQRHGQCVALLFLDLDHFKNINDALGHRVGDALLCAVAQRLSSLLREQDTIARLGGDEFILVLPDTDAVGAAHVAEKLLRAADQPFDIDAHELVITPSMGIAMYPQDGKDFDTLSRCADAAMYIAKQGGRNHYRFFTAEMQADSDRSLLLENALRRALERNQLYLHYQPQVCVASGAIVGAEALLRWEHPELGRVSPAEFIPVAESSGMILPMGDWVLQTATRQLREWMDQGYALTMAVNVSLVQFRQADFPQRIGQILQDAGLPPHCLELELTEGVAMTDPALAIDTMDRLHQQGVLLSIDDFGTGYSSLNHLKKFKVYKLKIDQSFVRDIADDPDDRGIVSAIISMAQGMDMRTIAEGVETAEQLAFLQDHGCMEVQGYLFGRPMAARDFGALLQAGPLTMPVTA
ncbi:EAL domain-containing protein [Acidovorax sp. 210-6]|uniref:bifunctional diguanylate cyclase/phosphodiesterase n=1 Tax=Acidovorax sp. 210-6 TaxID=2699468 RepID=UPI0013896A3F|nr:EAL domain-containing protein [Acidovorax sp. 210-6]NCU65743.1 EAL domain-containing protein [Acidovorax sp. 210-6]